MDPDSIDRARRRLTALRSEEPDGPTLQASLDRAREQLEALAQTAAELEATVPDRVASGIHEALRQEVLPVGRHIAEVRGLSAQTIRRLERLQNELEAERKARVEDLALLVDLVVSGWRGVERRLDRLERTLDRVERALDREAEQPPGPSLLRPLADELRHGA
ncbi:MAG: hypothetical protein R3C15_05150 [Thermoleophilia bacterium]